ncbi:unnamed protein product [Brassica napus]|uniref:(rape) hypothetical protein n=1 Tax=Brassica napus TaxID=3708 RepID=A0A816MUY3_BRANA|nr:unnamed protein product [Brassica napus]
MQSKIGGGGLPPAFSLFPSLNKTFTFHQILVLITTFLAYAVPTPRKPPSIVKSVPRTFRQRTIKLSDRQQMGSVQRNRRNAETRRARSSVPIFLRSQYVFRGAFRRYDRSEAVFVFGMMGSGILNVHLLGFYMTIQIVLWVVSIYRVALCCLCGCELVWEGEAWVDYGCLELSYICWEDCWFHCCFFRA